MVEKSQVNETLTQAIDGQAVYEVGFHVVPNLSDEAVVAVVEKIRQALGDAEIISEQVPQRMTLAYTIERADSGKREKFTESYFGVIKFATSPDATPALSEKLRGMQDVLRYLLIETVREEVGTPRRAVFSSNRLEGETIKKPVVEEKSKPVSEEDLDKTIEAIVA